MALKNFQVVGYMPLRVRRDLKSDLRVGGLLTPTGHRPRLGSTFDADDKAMRTWIDIGSLVETGAASAQQEDPPKPPKPPKEDPDPELPMEEGE